MSKKKKKQEPQVGSEAKGLFLISLGILFFLALYSFVFLHPERNYLGYLGYVVALGAKSIFGFGSYLISLYLIFLGVRLIRKQKIHPTDHLYFGIWVSSVCMLLTVFAETLPERAAALGEGVVSETLTLTFPYRRTLVRFYLGGFPYYYLFSDLPLLYLQKSLSPIGTTLIFFSLGFVSFLLLTGVKIVTRVVLLWKGIGKLFGLIFQIFKPKPAPTPKSPKVYSGIKINHLPQEPKKKLTQILKQPPPSIPKIKTLKKGESVIWTEKKTKQHIPIPTKNLMVSSNSSYQLPTLNLLSSPKERIDQPTLKKDLMHQAAILEETLKSFGIEAKVGEVNSGPTITSFEVHPSVGVKVQKIKALENDIALNMQAKSIRIVLSLIHI